MTKDEGRHRWGMTEKKLARDLGERLFQLECFDINLLCSMTNDLATHLRQWFSEELAVAQPCVVVVGWFIIVKTMLL